MNACPQAPAHDEKHNARDAVKRKHPDEEVDLGVPTPEYPCGVIHREQGYKSEYVWDAFQDVLNIAERLNCGTAGIARLERSELAALAAVPTTDLFCLV